MIASSVRFGFETLERRILMTYFRLDADGQHLDMWDGNQAVGVPTQYVDSSLPGLTDFSTTQYDHLILDFSAGDLLTGNYKITYFGDIRGDNTVEVIGTSSADNISVSSSQITINNRQILLTNIHSVVLDPGQGADTLSVASGAAATLAAAPVGGQILARTFAGLSIGAGSTLTIGTTLNTNLTDDHSDRTLVLAPPSFTNSGTLDLGDNDMVVQGGSVAGISASLANGFNNGTWNGVGIISSVAALDTTHLTTIGLLANTQGVFSASNPFDDYSAATTDVLLKYTYFGDANLDGKIDGSDYSRIDNGYLQKLTGWYNGDFNYDGVINGSDYTLIDNAFNTQGASLSPVTLTATVPQAIGTLANNSLISELRPIQITGTTLPNTPVRLDMTGAGFTGGTVTSAANGSFTFNATLAAGLNPIRIEASYLSGQQGIFSLPVTLNQVYFDDPNVEQAVYTQLNLPASHVLTAADMSGLTTLTANTNIIESLTGLQWATNLQTLTLKPADYSVRSPLTDLTALSSLSNLSSLTVVGASLTSTSLNALAGNAGLSFLDLRYNQIGTVSALSGLNKLTTVRLYGNSITNLSGLYGKPISLDLPPGNIGGAQNIASLAAALDYMPLQQYAWVLNNCSYQPYYGAMKGAEAAFETKTGDDWDLSILLQSLFASDGIQTRFVTGTVQSPISTVQAWLGMLNASAAYNLLIATGLNPTVSGSNFQFTHTWLEAQLPNSSGVMQWYDFDPSWKFKQYQPGIQGIVTSVPFNQTGYLSQVTTQLPVDYYENQVESYLRTNMPGKSLADVPYVGPIVPQDVTSLPSATPFTVVGTTTTSPTVPVSLTYRIQLILLDYASQQQEFQYTVSLPQSSLSRITIGYSSLSSYLLPHLYLGGVDVADGGMLEPSSNMMQLDVNVFMPNATTSAFVYDRQAGQYLALAVDAYQISSEQLLRDQQVVTSADIAELDGQTVNADSQIGGFLALAGDTYFTRFDNALQTADGLLAAEPSYNYVKTSLVSSNSSVTFYSQLAFPYIPTGLTFDEQGGDWWSIPLAYDYANEPARDSINGLNGSALESGLWEELTDTPSISTIKSLQIAAQSGNPVYTITSSNESALIPKLTVASSVISSVESSISSGDSIIIPQNPTLLQSWNGVGWIVVNSAGEDIGFEIEGGLSGSTGPSQNTPMQGGSTTGTPTLGPVNQQIASYSGTPNPDNSDSVTGDPVNIANGNLTDDETDLSLPGIGMPLAFSRHYDSQVTADIGMGPGWVYSYSDHLVTGTGGVITWYTSRGYRYAFTPNGSGGYTNPQTLFGTFTLSAGIYVYRDKDGTAYSFNSSGSLTRIQDPDGNGVNVTYNGSGQIQQVSELADPTRWLSFTFSSGHLASVTDFTGRTWNYAYSNSDLSTVTPPSNPQTLPAIVKYSYYTDTALGGLLYRITSANGAVRTYNYFADRRAMSVTDALGNTEWFAYNIYREQTVFSDNRGNATINGYNIDGTLNMTTHPDGAIEFYSWTNGLKASWTDASDDTTSYQYDGFGNIVQQTDAAGNSFTFTYSPGTSHLLSSTAPGSRTTSYTYDGNWNCLSIRDPMGNLTTMTYGAYGLMLTLTQPDGNVTGHIGNYTTTYTYDTAGEVLTCTTGLPSVTSYTYDGPGDLLSYTDADDHTTSYTYDLASRVLTTTNALNGIETNTYDAMGDLLSSTDQLGRVTYYAYDLNQNLLSTTEPDGSFLTNIYDANGNRIEQLNELDCLTQFIYDSRNRNIGTLLPTGGTSWQDFNGDGLLASTTDDGVEDFVYTVAPPFGNTTSYSYDVLGRLTTTTDPDGGTITRTYDAVGNLLSTTDPLGHATTGTYDLDNHQLTNTDPLGHTTHYIYDANGNLLSSTDPLNHVTTYGYDVLGRRTTVTSATNGVTTTLYDAVGNVLKLTDPDGNSTTYSYDALNRVSTETNQLGFSDTYGYDAVGNETSMTDRDGRARHFVYNDRNLQTAELWLAGENTIYTITCTYDAAGDLKTATDPDSAYNYLYDTNGNAISIDNAGTPGVPDITLKPYYDLNNDLAGVSDYVSGTFIGYTGYLYSNMNRPDFINIADASYNYSSMSLYYNTVGNLSSTYFGVDSNSVYSNVSSSSYAYDNDERLTGLTYDNAAAVSINNYTWIFDAASNITQMTSDEGTVNYTYDADNQLTSATSSVKSPESYSYDANGNRTNSGDQTGGNNEILSDGTYTYTYDGEGNRLTRTDKSGNVTLYAWDYRNRLTSVTVRNSSGQTTEVVDYTYDMFNRRISETVYGNGPTQPATLVQRYVWNGNNIELQFDGNGNLTDRYIHGLVAGQVYGDRSPSDSQTVWYLTDQLGTVRDIINNSGVVLNHISYDSFGNITTQTNSSTGVKFGFTGQQYDAATGLYYMNARYYDPKTGTFISQDPIGFNAGDPNLFRYVGNEVTRLVDPFGLCANGRGSQSSSADSVLPSSTLANTDGVNSQPPQLPGYEPYKSIGSQPSGVTEEQTTFFSGNVISQILGLEYESPTVTATASTFGIGVDVLAASADALQPMAAQRNQAQQEDNAGAGKLYDELTVRGEFSYQVPQEPQQPRATAPPIVAQEQSTQNEDIIPLGLDSWHRQGSTFSNAVGPLDYPESNYDAAGITKR